jgi:hypothetical protein
MSEKTISRRELLKAMTALGGALAAISLPERWMKPVIGAGVLPAHAQGTGEIPPPYPGPQPGGSKRFNYTGGEQTFVVPAEVAQVTVEAWGAGGGWANSLGGRGGYLKTTLSVTPGETLYVYVGGAGGSYTGGLVSGGFNGGGAGGFGDEPGAGGGGASDLRQGGKELANRVVVAGGGGGGGIFSAGGAGGGTTGVKGVDGTDCTGGGGGTQSDGGGGGTGIHPGSAGDLAIGGAGSIFGGGGGGGYYGGGGAGSGIPFSGGGGGGGSSYPPGAAHQQGVNSGNGTVLISW